jgi:hypothetical protein
MPIVKRFLTGEPDRGISGLSFDSKKSIILLESSKNPQYSKV